MLYNEDYLIVNMKTRHKYLALNVVFCEAVNILSHLDLCVYFKSVVDWSILKIEALLILLALNRTLITQLLLLVVVVLIIFKIAECEYEI